MKPIIQLTQNKEHKSWVKELKIKQTQPDYSVAVNTIKNAILRSQYQAAKLINRDMLSLYYGIGKYVSENSRESFWGTGAIKTISERLRKELPGLRGFSETSIRKMRQFYEQWSPTIEKSTATAVKLSTEDESNNGEIEINALITPNSTAMAVNFNMEEFLELSFSHHVEILNKVEDLETRVKYISLTLAHHWPKEKLREELKNKTAEHLGKMPSNFPTTIQNSREMIKALNMFKDEYLLDFMTVYRQLSIGACYILPMFIVFS